MKMETTRSNNALMRRKKKQRLIVVVNSTEDPAHGKQKEATFNGMARCLTERWRVRYSQKEGKMGFCIKLTTVL